MKQVPSPGSWLGGLDATGVAALVTAAADLSLILDADGTVVDVSFGSEDMAREGYRKWIGQPWIETVTPDSRSKVEALLRDAADPGDHKWRYVNHNSSRGGDVPVLYSAVRAGRDGQIVAFGRDMREMTGLQQRLMDAQQSMERDYWRLRNVETRYRMLFQISAEAILIVDAATDKVVEANPAVAELLGDSAKRVIGKTVFECLGVENAQVMQTLVAGARATGRTDDISIRLGIDRREYLVSSFYLRQGNDALYLLRIALPRIEMGPAQLPKTVLRALEFSADAFAVTDIDGRVVATNRAFLDLSQMPSDALARGESLDRWIGRSRVDFSVLMANLRQHGTIRLFATTLTGEHGAVAEVEVSGVAMPAADPPCMGFNIRDVGRRIASDATGHVADQPRSVAQLTELVGRVPLKELVRDATDLVEKLCIEAALQLTRDNRASAAEVLGLSRQSLYVKLRRYGLGDATGESDDAET
ncbi:MAG: transcriptional regulator PpsR [Dokdonella sp.]|uniref:transcriptional regulator PpsR n=1 Tax=Dokdonella sp. TaxID=2291710 RepID=UPI0032643ABF